MSLAYIKTMKDLESAAYGMPHAGGNQLMKAAGIVGGFGTPHDSPANAFTAASGLSSLYNVIYGQKVWSMLNQEINALAVLSKKPYTSSGWRVLVSRPSGGSGAALATNTTSGAVGATSVLPTNLGGQPENEELGTGNLLAQAPEYDTLYMSPKTIAHMFDFSELSMEMAKIDDGVGDIRAIVREDMGKFHAEVQSKMLLTPLENYDHANTLTIEQNYTSLLKVVSNRAEFLSMDTLSMVPSTNGQSISNAVGSGSNINSALVTLYGNTSRATTTGFMDSVVNFGGAYNASTIRSFTLTIINNLLQELRLNGASPKVILSGYDTIQALADLLQAQERFMDRKEIIPTHGGVKGVKGREVGFRVATYFDIPIIPCKDMTTTNATSSATDGISDMLVLDTDHLWLSVMKPTQYFEDGINNGNPFGVGVLGNRGLYRTMGEIGCSFFKGQGKITNLS
jgi:hypothetical protein